MVDGGLLCAGKYPVVTQERPKTRDMEYNNKEGG